MSRKLNGRGTDYLPPDEEELDLTMENELALASAVAASAKDENLTAVPFADVAALLKTMNEYGAPKEDYHEDCFGCHVALFADPDESQTKIMQFVDRIINLVSLEHLYKAIYEKFEEQRKNRIILNGGHVTHPEWTLDMIKEHFEKHIVDYRIQDRKRTDSLLLYENLLKNCFLLKNDQTGKLDVNEKLYKLWLSTMETIRKLGILPDESIFSGYIQASTAGDNSEPVGTAGGASRKKRFRHH